MEAEYMQEGYRLMIDYVTVNRIKTKNRKFLRRLNKFYEKNKDKKYLDLREENEYLKLEYEFYSEICKPTNRDEEVALSVLEILMSDELLKS